jgi:hypothetical protein
MVIVVAPPRVDEALRVRDRFEAVHVETFIAEATVDAFDKRLRYGLAGPEEVEGDPTPIGPLVEDVRRAFGAVIDRNRPWQRPSADTASRASTTLRPVSDTLASSRTRSRLHWSITVNTRHVRPEANWSCTKSMLQY